MTPSQLASHLRQIASKIDASKKPNRHLVASELKRTIAMVSKTANAPVVEASHFENGDYSPDEYIASFGDSNRPGPVWVGQTGFGWIISNVDFSTISDETPVGGNSPYAETWGALKADPDLNPALANAEKYSSIQDFAADPHTITWLCDWHDESKPEVERALTEAGFTKAAQAVQGVVIELEIQPKIPATPE